MIYFLLDAMPGDYSDIYLNDPRLTAEQRAILRQRMGLDRPVYERYAKWMINLFKGDFGTSFSNFQGFSPARFSLGREVVLSSTRLLLAA